MITERLLLGAAFAFGCIGVVLRFQPPVRDESPPPLSAIPASTQRPTHLADEDPSLPQSIISSDVFAPSRTPPAVRFAPERSADQPALRVIRHTAKSEDSGVRLFGITVTPRGAVALIEREPRSGTPAIYRVGDRIGDASVTAITDSTVRLAGPRGERLLRLPAVRKPTS